MFEKGMSLESRKARNREQLERLKRAFNAVIGMLEQGIEEDTLETVQATTYIQETDISQDTDTWCQFAPGPWRRLEVVWQKREVNSDRT